MGERMQKMKEKDSTPFLIGVDKMLFYVSEIRCTVSKVFKIIPR